MIIPYTKVINSDLISPYLFKNTKCNVSDFKLNKVKDIPSQINVISTDLFDPITARVNQENYVLKHVESRGFERELKSIILGAVVGVLSGLPVYLFVFGYEASVLGVLLSTIGGFIGGAIIGGVIGYGLSKLLIPSLKKKYSDHYTEMLVKCHECIKRRDLTATSRLYRILINRSSYFNPFKFWESIMTKDEYQRMFPINLMEHIYKEDDLVYRYNSAPEKWHENYSLLLQNINKRNMHETLNIYKELTDEGFNPFNFWKKILTPKEFQKFFPISFLPLKLSQDEYYYLQERRNSFSLHSKDPAQWYFLYMQLIKYLKRHQKDKVFNTYRALVGITDYELLYAYHSPELFKDEAYSALLKEINKTKKMIRKRKKK